MEALVDILLLCPFLCTALGAALTCASAAVADAGIEMYDVVIGCQMVRSWDLC